MSQHQKDVKHLETNGRYGKEIDGDQLLRMILQESAARSATAACGRGACIC
jgi:hypothetical protein